MNATLTRFWGEYGTIAIPTALAIALVLISATIWRTTRHHTRTTKSSDPLSTLVTLMALGLTAEGMYWVLTTKLAMPLPWWLAIFVCGVAEGLMVNFFRLARDFQERHGRPGPFGTAFWIVAVAEGAVVALASPSLVEIALRILLPLGVALLHWIKLVAEGSTAHRGRLVWTPLNLLIRIGAWRPGTTTIDEAEVARVEDKLTKAAYMLASSSELLKNRRARRVRRMMLQASPEAAAKVIQRLELAYGIEARIAAVTTGGSQAVQEASGTDTVETTSTPLVLPSTTPVNGHPIIDATTTPTISATPEPAPSTDMEVVEGGNDPALPTAVRDTYIVVTYWDQLVELMRQGKLRRSKIESTCRNPSLHRKVLARQANRIMDIVGCAYAMDATIPVEDRVRTAIERIEKDSQDQKARERALASTDSDS